VNKVFFAALIMHSFIRTSEPQSPRIKITNSPQNSPRKTEKVDKIDVDQLIDSVKRRNSNPLTRVRKQSHDFSEAHSNFIKECKQEKMEPNKTESK